MRYIALCLTIIATLSACTSTPEEVRTYRETNCPLSQINPSELQIGNFVQILVSGNKGQVIEIPQYKSTAESVIDNKLARRSWCVTLEQFKVRVNTRGIASEGVGWGITQPEVLPIIPFAHFEIMLWEETNN